MKPHTRLFILATLLGVAFPIALQAQSTAFTYQGRLSEGGSPASGSFDLEFRLFDAVSNGSQVGSVRTIEDLTVTDGLFTAPLDFGGVFDGRDRFIEISVRPGADTGAYLPLSPRQRLTATPYAVKALEAIAVPVGTITSDMLAEGAVTSTKIAEGAVSGLGTPDGSNTGVVTVTDGGLVGIGADSPEAGLQVTGGREILSLESLSMRVDESMGYTNLNAPALLTVQGDLLAVAAYTDDAITLMDISIPELPARLSQIKNGDGVFTNLNGAYDVALSGNLLAVSALVDDAVTLIDVTDPANPVRHRVLIDGVGGFNELDGAYTVALDGTLMAIAAINDDAVSLVDVSNPVSPVLRVVIKDGTFGFNDLDGAFFVELAGNLLAITALYDDAVTLVDVTNPSSPVLLSVLKDGVNGFDDILEPYGVAMQANLLAIAANHDNAVSLVDISNPGAPVLRSVMKDGVGGFNRLYRTAGVAFNGNTLAITAAGSSAVTLVDVTDPSNPEFLGYAQQNRAGIHGLGAAQGIAFHGTNLVVGGGSSDAVSLLRPTTRQVSLASSQWMGIGTTTPLAPLHVAGNVIVDSATEVNLTTHHFTVGRLNQATGDYSSALGESTTASGAYSTATGNGSTASGYVSTAMGQNTTASGSGATAMGSSTMASGYVSTAMGYNTTASGSYSTAMGRSSTASGDYSTASGYVTTASGHYSTAMGRSSQATNHYTFAAGYNARAYHAGSFVWNDGGGLSTSSAADNSVTMRARGGFRFLTTSGTTGAQLAANATSWSVLSDRNRKKNIQPLDGQEVLEKLAQIPISTWNYDFESATDTPHIGPMAQDFKAAFYPGRDDTSITTLESDGVALAAIQGLNVIVKEKESQIAELQARLASLETLVEELTSNPNP